MNEKKKPLAAMAALVVKRWTSYLGAMFATVMIVLIGFATPLLLAETIDKIHTNGSVSELFD